ncbi:MAG: CHAD domain-containing protein [Planctomycetes bacterium]|nr:CHAD domain-containing protein [Planctomycetota bacterium]
MTTTLDDLDEGGARGPRAAIVSPRATLALDPGLPAWDGLLAAFASVLAYAAAQVARAGRDPGKAVHEYRKSIRRARAVVRLVRPLLKRARYLRLDGALREAVQETSFVRDAEVVAETVDALPASEGALEAAAALRHLLLARQATVCSPAAIREVLARGAARLALLPLRLAKALPARLDLADLEAALAASYRRARRRARAARRSGEAEAIHDWRKRTKELRYQLELLEPAPQPRERALGRVAKGLGRVTDLVILRQAVDEHAESLGPEHTGVLTAALERLVTALFAEVADGAAPLLADRPRAFARAALAPAPTSEVDRPPGARGERPRAAANGRRLGPFAPVMPSPPARALARPAPAMPRTGPPTPATRSPRP